LKNYLPSNHVPVLGILFMLLVLVIGGITIGFLMHFIGKLIYLILFFPLGAGAIGGFALAQAIKSGKVRNKYMAIIFASLMGLIIYSSYFYFKYENFKNGVYETFSLQLQNSENNQQTAFSKDKLSDLILVNETGMKGFLGFIKYSAKIGVSISKVGRSSDRGIAIKEPWIWGYYLVELSLIAGLAIIIAADSASQPFCERCDSWYSDDLIVGYIPETEADKIIYALKNNNLHDVGSLISKFKLTAPCLKIVQQHCLNCQSEDIYLKVFKIEEKNGQENESKVLSGMITPEEYQKLI